MLHGVADRRGWGRWGSKVLLWRRHHVVRVGHNGWLARIVPRMVVGGLRGSTGEGLTRGSGGVVLDGHGDEIAVFACC